MRLSLTRIVTLGVGFWVLAVPAARAGDGPGVVAAEVGCGYVGGVAAAAGGALAGSCIHTDEFATGGFIGFFAAYPAGVGMGAWGAGEIWGEDSAHDWATAASAVGASYSAVVVGYAVGSWKGMVIGMLVAPAVATAAYNVVKVATEPESPASAERMYYVNYGFGF